ncbi:MAG: histidine phosphatase family protein, partial [Dehalococcoidia bacterium]|nr:histidine phosphatase family protein [Dehalococcoidia bacterium]
SLRRVQQRAWAAVQRIIRSHDETSVAIVSHSIVTQTVVLAALDSPLVAFPRFTPGVASINILHIQNNFTTLKVLNDTCHLEGV